MMDNVRFFLERVSTVKAEHFIFTGPNCFAPIHMNQDVYDHPRRYIEAGQPDHNAWYSPFTLKIVLEKYGGPKAVEGGGDTV